MIRKEDISPYNKNFPFELKKMREELLHKLDLINKLLDEVDHRCEYEKVRGRPLIWKCSYCPKTVLSM